MNPETYINNELGNIWYEKNIKQGDKITLYKFDENQLSMIDLIRVISTDYQLDVNEVLLRYIPDIETHKGMTYTFINTEKCRGDRWVVLLAEDGEEVQINLSETVDMFYSVHSL